MLARAASALLVAYLASAAAAQPAQEATPLEIERQQIGGRLEVIERKQEERDPPPARVLPPAPGLRPYEPFPLAAPLDAESRRLDLERRGLEQRRQGIDRDLRRMGGDSNPSSSGLLDRLRRD